MKYLLPVVFLLVSSCHSLPEDPTEDFRNLITSQTQDFSQEENWYQGFQPDFPAYERYIKHFRFFENFEEHKIPKHFLGRFQWKEENYASLNIFIPENPKATIAFYHGFLGSARLWVHALRYYMEQDFALVLIDLPPGTGDVALDIHSYVPKSQMIVVTTPHPNAADIAVKAGLGAKQIGHDVLGVIENMSYLMIPERQDPIYLFGQGGGEQVSQILNVPLLGQIPIESPVDGDLHLEGLIFDIYVHIAKQL